jgi:hypothetical protein
LNTSLFFLFNLSLLLVKQAVLAIAGTLVAIFYLVAELPSTRAARDSMAAMTTDGR